MITPQEFKARRQMLAKQLPENSVALIPTATEVLRNGDVHYAFRQCSDFYYLTGFNEPEALLVIMGGHGESILFNRPYNVHEEQWTGKRLGQENASTHLGVDAAYSIATLDEKLPEILADKQRIYYPMGRSHDWDKYVLRCWQTLKAQARRGVRAADAFYDLMPFLGEMRLIKSPAEIACMRRAAEISVAAHKRAMQAGRYARYEYELEAEIRYELIRHGSRHLAYESIVAGGNNACVLHYTANNQPLKLGDLVLIDAGGEFENYAADITRTFPVSGQFSPEQRLLYDLVLHSQKAGIACIKPGIKWNEIQRVIVKTLTQGLIDLGILKGHADDLIHAESYRPFYMHNSGHWLGLDVHDSGAYKIDGAWRDLTPGMVLTVEPGLYLDAACDEIDARWRGIGVRIEDDILVTEKGYENLTAGLPVESYEIEAYMRG